MSGRKHESVTCEDASMKKIPHIAAFLFAGALLLTVVGAAFLATGCDGPGDSATTAAIAADSAAGNNTPQDRAAKLAAQSQLRNAQTAQEVFFVNHERYATSTAELRGEDPGVSVKVEVTKGTADGFEMQVKANDAGGTLFILRKNGTRIERVDGNGDSW